MTSSTKQERYCSWNGVSRHAGMRGRNWDRELLTFGQRWEVPQDIQGPVILRASLRLNLVGKLYSLLYKVYPPTIRVEYRDGGVMDYRLVWQNVKSGFLVSSLPRDVDTQRRFFEGGEADGVRSITFVDDNGCFVKGFHVTWLRESLSPTSRSPELRAASGLDRVEAAGPVRGDGGQAGPSQLMIARLGKGIAMLQSDLRSSVIRILKTTTGPVGRSLIRRGRSLLDIARPFFRRPPSPVPSAAGLCGAVPQGRQGGWAPDTLRSVLPNSLHCPPRTFCSGLHPLQGLQYHGGASTGRSRDRPP